MGLKHGFFFLFLFFFLFFTIKLKCSATVPVYMFGPHSFTAVTCVNLTSIWVNCSSQSGQIATGESCLFTGQFHTDNRAVVILEEKITDVFGQRGALIFGASLREPGVTLGQ